MAATGELSNFANFVTFQEFGELWGNRIVSLALEEVQTDNRAIGLIVDEGILIAKKCTAESVRNRFKQARAELSQAQQSSDEYNCFFILHLVVFRIF